MQREQRLRGQAEWVGNGQPDAAVAHIKRENALRIHALLRWYRLAAAQLRGAAVFAQNGEENEEVLQQSFHVDP